MNFQIQYETIPHLEYLQTYYEIVPTSLTRDEEKERWKHEKGILLNSIESLRMNINELLNTEQELEIHKFELEKEVEQYKEELERFKTMLKKQQMFKEIHEQIKEKEEFIFL